MQTHVNISDFTQVQNDLDEIIAELQKCIGSVFATDKL